MSFWTRILLTVLWERYERTNTETAREPHVRGVTMSGNQ